MAATPGGSAVTRALVADDDRTAATLLRRTLERWDLEVVVAQDGFEAWHAVQAHPDIGWRCSTGACPASTGWSCADGFAATPRASTCTSCC